MSSIVLDSKKDVKLQPASELWQKYRPENAQYAFTAVTVEEAREWQAQASLALASTIGVSNDEPGPMQAFLVETVEKDGYIREKLLIQTGPHTSMPLYLLLPIDAPRPLPVVIAFNGHGYGVKDIVGLWEDGDEREQPEGYQKDFAVGLCKAGFAVAAPEIACFGERQTDFSYIKTEIGQEVPSSCTHAAMLAFHLGSSVLGMRVRDGMRLIDYLETRQELDTGRLGAMGISGGGMHTFFSTCLDHRIKACVVSGYYSTFQDSILSMAHCACNFVPGLGKFGEMYDLAGLIAPRPMLVESGSRDPIFPRPAVEQSLARARVVYELLGSGENLQADYFEGRHQVSGRMAYDFLRQALA